MIKLIAFDTFGTIFDTSQAGDGEVAAYNRHMESCRDFDSWRPLRLPDSWKTLQAFPDVKPGLAQLRSLGYRCVTCSNGPAPLLHEVSKHNGLVWDGIVPLEAARVFKPDLRAYLHVCRVWNVSPAEVMMVTANRTFGDLEAAEMLGMQPQLIRDEQARTKDVMALADLMLM